MLHRNGPNLQVGKYFYCLLGNAVSNDDIIVTSQQRFVSRRWSACVQAGGGHFEHHFSHHCPYADLLTNFTLKCAN